jgi:hypothetical protein
LFHEKRGGKRNYRDQRVQYTADQIQQALNFLSFNYVFDRQACVICSYIKSLILGDNRLRELSIIFQYTVQKLQYHFGRLLESSFYYVGILNAYKKLFLFSQSYYSVDRK